MKLQYLREVRQGRNARWCWRPWGGQRARSKSVWSRKKRESASIDHFYPLLEMKWPDQDIA